MGWRYGSRGRRKGSWTEYWGSKFSMTVLAPMPRVAPYPWASVVLLQRRVCKTWQRDQRGKPHVSLAGTRQTQAVGNWERKKKKNQRKSLQNPWWEHCPHLQVVSQIGERTSPPNFQGWWVPSLFQPTVTWTVTSVGTCKTPLLPSHVCLTFKFPPFPKVPSTYTVSSKGNYEGNHIGHTPLTGKPGLWLGVLTRFYACWRKVRS